MTTLTLLTRSGSITGFEVSGHSGYSESGSDIVCAYISSAVQQAMTAITDIMDIATEVKIDSESAEIFYLLPKSISEEENKIVKIVLLALEKNCQTVQEEYPDFFKIVRSEVYDD